MDYAKVQRARKPSFAPPRSPVSPLVQKTLTEKGIALFVIAQLAFSWTDKSGHKEKPNLAHLVQK